MKYLFIFSLCLSHAHVYAGGIVPVAGARAAAMGGTSVCVSDAWSVCNNQAAMSLVKRPCFGIFMQNRYGVNGANLCSIGALMPLKHMACGLSSAYFGNAFYHEQHSALALSSKLSKHFAIGLAGSYRSLGMQGYGSTGSITMEAGLLTILSERCIAGFHVYNPLRSKLSSGEHITSRYRFGVQYKPSAPLLLQAELIQTDALRTDMALGISYTLKDRIMFMCGVSTLKPQFSFGFGLKKECCDMVLAHTYHPYLGTSTNISFVFSAGRKSESDK